MRYHLARLQGSARTAEAGRIAVVVGRLMMGESITSVSWHVVADLEMATYRIDIHTLHRQHPILPILPILARPLLNLLERLIHLLALDRQRRAVAKLARHGITRLSRALFLLLEMRLRDLLVVLVDDFYGDAFHAEDFNLEALSARVGVFDVREVFFVHLVHVHGETWS